ncbi:uncharacterized protein F5Z01DRAFT_728821 [Emericellopsis atlantica]|uniref:Class I SAM-dependent methyltransferase n=1 Tax=Emericellopsis atlantica TaxID=2614577 RepID=A0A9P7ZGT9_9HYPO|nr:uncharacterized protein F5Z01DRAFT_728821 [Emericellopsis atlantica]KAG9251300.1 hypothetical protein F5Z01DRAFT_728821 [Emericellopsis atlantica]
MPLVPRMHLFEIDDQTWFPPFLRRLVQTILLRTWHMQLPFIQPLSPGRMIAHLLIRELGDDLGNFTFVDFCAGAGGPTPILEKEINHHLRTRRKPEAPVQFVLTDLHPNLPAWEGISKKNPHITYEREPVDASRAPPQLVTRGDGKKLMRLFNLAFHHFDDPLAKDILRDTVQTSQGFAIFELQGRTIESFIAVSLLPLLVMVVAPVHAWKHKSLASLIFMWFIPIIPFVLVWDGWISALRTREPDEVEALLRSCGADSSKWEIKSGSQQHLWPVGYVDWIICQPRDA